MGEIVRSVLHENGVEDILAEKAVRVLQELDMFDAITEMHPLEKGMTNQLFHFIAREEEYLLRLPGAGTEAIVNRRHEVAVYEALDGYGITEDILYINGESGIKVAKFITESHACDKDDKAEVIECMKLLKKFHQLKLSVPHVFDIFAEIRLYEEHCGICIGTFSDCMDTRAHVMELRDLIKSIPKEQCLCHIDPIYDNFLVRGDQIRLIDWEYAAMCDPYIDIAMMCIYAEYDKDYTDELIREYLGEEASRETKMLIYAYMSAASYLWVLWCEIKKMEGVDYQEYEEGQYRIAKDFYRYAIELYRQKK